MASTAADEAGSRASRTRRFQSPLADWPDTVAPRGVATAAAAEAEDRRTQQGRNNP